MELVFSSSLSSTLTVTKILRSPRHATTGNMQGYSRFPLFFTIASRSNASQAKHRRSANYHPTIWDPKAIECLRTPYTYDGVHGARLQKLKDEVRSLLTTFTKEPCGQLKLIDSMQRLGVSYHFREEIKEILNLVELDSDSDLYTTALHFRLLRQHGFTISKEVFEKFRNEDGKFKDSLKEDILGLLSLYDASYLGMHGEHILEEAKDFSTEQLKSLPGRSQGDIVTYQVKQALDVPLHWRMQRIENRNYINIYQKEDTNNLALLELAKLDYNLVQSVYQTELKELARWWIALGFREKLHFSRDRLMENYLWSMGMIFEPHFSKCRIYLTKFICILSSIDDMYDIYGSLDELELFTSALKRWDPMALEELPDYMKICYLAILNFASELVYDVLKEEGLYTLPFIRDEWVKLCQAYLVEARWFNSGYTPTFDEYLENAWISVGGHEAIVHACALLGHTSTEDFQNFLKHGFELIYWSSLLVRLNDDLGTSPAEIKRGDVVKSIQCYMIEKGVSEREAKDHIGGLISHAWKILNEESVKHSLSRSLVNMCLNMTRTAQCIFQYGDGIGTSTGVTKDCLESLIIEPIP
ncbi:probable terpene synthase 9 [Ricinus communis]|nr:probable terpene synthase 9 [Ricinus communis]